MIDIAELRLSSQSNAPFCTTQQAQSSEAESKTKEQERKMRKRDLSQISVECSESISGLRSSLALFSLSVRCKCKSD